MTETQLDLLETRGKVRADHPDTARDAAEQIEPRTGTLRATVLRYLRMRGDLGATDAEMQRALGMDGNTERPRRVELVEAELIADSGRRRIAPNGRRAIVWIALA